MTRKKRIGIFGGTFNPPHLGHLALAQESIKKLKLDKIIFIPTFLPPHKAISRDTAYKRYRMVVLACRKNPLFEVSKVELERGTVSYSVDTLTKLKKKYGKGVELFFITGADSLKELRAWKDVDRLMKLATFIVAQRPGFPIGRAKRKLKVIGIPLLDISSSMIRNRVRSGLPIRYLVPEAVRKFIIKNRLYK